MLLIKVVHQFYMISCKLLIQDYLNNYKQWRFHYIVKLLIFEQQAKSLQILNNQRPNARISKLSTQYCDNPKRNLMITPSDHQKVTLQEYLQTYNIRKKIEQRKRSKSKGKDPMIKTEQQQKMDGTFAIVDHFVEHTKIELEDFLMNSDIPRQKILLYLLKSIDDLMVKLKEEISKMYKDVYVQYLIESKDQEGVINKDVGNYFKEKMITAIEEKKKANLAERIKDNFKKEEKNAFITKLIIGDVMQAQKTPQKSDKKQESPKKRGQSKVETVKTKASDEKEPPRNERNQEPPRGNSFMEALFGLVQKQEEKITAVPNDSEANPPALLPKDSKVSGPFERKQSVKEMLRSPKANKLLKGISPH